MKLPAVKQLPPKTQFRTELLGIAAYNAYVHHNSPARQQMFTNSHLAQKLVIRGMTENFQSTFMDDALGMATFNIEMPCTGRILKIIERYPASDSANAISMNPETVVMYENMETKEVASLVITRFLSYHAYFGFELVPTEHASKIRVGAIIEKGTVLYDSPGRTSTGRYISGIMLNTAFIGHMATSEDGLVVCRDILPALRHKRYEVRSMEWGEDAFPLNGFGTEDVYKIFPDIGELVREDGLLMAKRRFDPRMTPVDLSINGVRRIYHNYDECLYAKGKGGRVVDVKVTVNYDYEKRGLSPVNAQLEKYIQGRNRFHRALVEEYYRLKKQTNGTLTVSRPLHVMLVQAMIDLEQGKNRFQKVYRKVPIDHVRVDFVIEYEVEPNIGFKLTETHGGKGVICHIAERHEMPVDMYGRSADIAMAAESRTNRMNSGGLHEHFYNDASWHTRRKVLTMLNLEYFEGLTLSDRQSVSYKREAKLRSLVKARELWIQQLHQTNPAMVEQAWEFVINYYRAIAPLQAHVFDRHNEIPWKMVYSNLATIVEDFTYLEIPPDYAVNYMDAMPIVKEHVGFERGPVQYVGYSGNKVMTKRPVRIAPMKWMLLEKTADSWSAVSVAKIQHFGFLAQINNADKYSHPGRPQPIKGVGETEGRILVSTCGYRATAELADRNNSPRTQRLMYRGILQHPTPGNIERLIDREELPYGSHKGVQILHHFLNCGGIALKFAPEEGT